MPLLPIIFLAGPTAVGKSDAALHLAEGIGGEIVSCDSMQIYKEIRIASNVPPPDALKRVPHHLVHVCSVEEEFDVARYNQMALAAIGEIHARGRVPVVVGGSGLYMQVLLDGIFEGGRKNEALRKDLKEQARRQGNQFLYDRLKAQDPEAAKKIHPNDVRRVIRALEVCLTADASMSEKQKHREGLWGKYDIALFVLNRERSALYRRIEARVETMMEEGLVGEIERLHKARWSLTAGEIIGVREVQGLLKREHDLEQVKKLMKLNTRRLAKRQLTWFRRDKRFQWVTVEEDDTPAGVADVIARKLNEQ